MYARPSAQSGHDRGHVSDAWITAISRAEEFRPQAVDRAVFSMITKGEAVAFDPQAGRLTQDTVRKLVQNVLERLATPVRYRSHEKPLGEVISLQAQLLSAHLEGTKRYRPFIARW